MSLKKDFEEFCRFMHVENTVERQQFGEDKLSYEEYVNKNEEFLLSSYEEKIKKDQSSS